MRTIFSAPVLDSDQPLKLEGIEMPDGSLYVLLTGLDGRIYAGHLESATIGSAMVDLLALLPREAAT